MSLMINEWSRVSMMLIRIFVLELVSCSDTKFSCTRSHSRPEMTPRKYENPWKYKNIGYFELGQQNVYCYFLIIGTKLCLCLPNTAKWYWLSNLCQYLYSCLIQKLTNLTSVIENQELYISIEHLLFLFVTLTQQNTLVIFFIN